MSRPLTATNRPKSFNLSFTNSWSRIKVLDIERNLVPDFSAADGEGALTELIFFVMYHTCFNVSSVKEFCSK